MPATKAPPLCLAFACLAAVAASPQANGASGGSRSGGGTSGLVSLPRIRGQVIQPLETAPTLKLQPPPTPPALSLPRSGEPIPHHLAEPIAPATPKRIPPPTADGPRGGVLSSERPYSGPSVAPPASAPDAPPPYRSLLPASEDRGVSI